MVNSAFMIFAVFDPSPWSTCAL